MSKRHYLTHASGHDHTIPSDIPFRSDLVFYAPMTEQCCCDYVSGCVPTSDTNGGSTTDFGSCEWDGGAGMWKCVCRQSNDYLTNMDAALNYIGLSLYSGSGTDNINSSGCTLFMQIQPIMTNGNQYCPYMIVDNLHVCFAGYEGTNVNIGTDVQDQAAGTSAFWIRRSSLGNFIDGTLYKVALTIAPNGDLKWYNNGVQKASSNWASKMKGNPTSVGILQVIKGTLREEAYVKDVRIYNRILTAAEVAQL